MHTAGTVRDDINSTHVHKPVLYEKKKNVFSLKMYKYTNLFRNHNEIGSWHVSSAVNGF